MKSLQAILIVEILATLTFLITTSMTDMETHQTNSRRCSSCFKALFRRKSRNQNLHCLLGIIKGLNQNKRGYLRVCK